MITRKDFNGIANEINKCYAATTEEELIKANIVQKLADYFKKNNPNFKTELFIKVSMGC